MNLLPWLLLAGFAAAAPRSTPELLTQKDSKCTPVALLHPSPKWPEKIKINGYRQDPVVSFDIKETGDVDRVLLTRSSGSKDIDQSVIKAVRRWKFKPGCGVRDVKMSVTIDFR